MSQVAHKDYPRRYDPKTSDATLWERNGDDHGEHDERLTGLERRWQDIKGSVYKAIVGVILAGASAAIGIAIDRGG
jgi:hypothetical protein